MQTINKNYVGAFIFSKDNQLLLGKSKKSGEFYENNWITPGGKIEKGESKLEAIKREVMEEVGIDISAFKIEMLPDVLFYKKEFLDDKNNKIVEKMNFFTFVIHTNQPAAEVNIQHGDDLTFLQWHPIAILNKLNMPPPSITNLKKMGYL